MTVEGQGVFRVRQWLASKWMRLLRFFRDSTNLGLVLLAVVVGLLGGAGAIVFRILIAEAHALFFGGSERALPFLGDARLILLPAAGLALGLVTDNPLLAWGGPIIALIFLAITAGLLVWDLQRPDRFYTILIRPQWRSWVAIGTFILLFFGVIVGLSILAAFAGAGGLMQVLWWPGGVLAILAAIYTGFIFAQSKARDLWLSPALPVHLLVQAAMAGAASLAILGLVVETTEQTEGFLHTVLLWSLVANLFVILVGELWLPHGTKDASKAAQMILRGQYSQRFWVGVVLVGHIVPVALLLANAFGGYELVAAAAGVCALAGLLAFEDVWVKAGQALPLS